MSSLRVPINPQTLSWALQRARMKSTKLAKSCGVSDRRVEAWLNGSEQPTYRQATVIAERLRVSLGELLLPPPEQEEIPLPDFRRGILAQSEPSLDLIETIYDALRKRDWWREYRAGTPVSFVGSADWRNSTPQQVAEVIRRHVPFQELARKAGDPSAFLRELARWAEDLGILVLRRSVVGNNNHRPLDPGEFSGFAIADATAPIIVINTNDYPRRLNFTFAHELAHIWVGQSAVDDNLEQQSNVVLERFCDQVAAELLVPRDEFLEAWRGRPFAAAEAVAEQYLVSVWVAARRAFDLKLIDRDDYQSIIDRYYKTLSRRVSDDGEEPSSGSRDFYRTLLARNSPTFVKGVIASVKNGDLTYKEAASLVGVSIRTMAGLVEWHDDEVSS